MESDYQGGLKLALYIAAVQSALASLFAIAVLLSEMAAMKAGLAGALIGLLASSCFALVSLRSGQDRTAEKVLFDLYMGQLSKWLVIIITMITAFKVIPDIDQGLNIFVLLGVFLLTQTAYIVIPLTLKNGQL